MYYFNIKKVYLIDIRKREKEKNKSKKKYLIDIRKCKRIYCMVFFIGKQKVVLFPKYKKND
jgi:hypothetical protein